MPDADPITLIEAYQGTVYQVRGPDNRVLAEARIGERSHATDALLNAHGTASGVFITAWNPSSVVVDRHDNEAAHDRLAQALAQRGVRFLPHTGIGADPSWTEHGLFALGLEVADALTLATAFQQNAIVLVRAGKPAELLLTELFRR
jgi:hypothetical protein